MTAMWQRLRRGASRQRDPDPVPPATRLARRTARHEWSDGPPEDGVLAMVASTLEEEVARRKRVRILVVGGPDVARWARILRAQWPTVRVLRAPTPSGDPESRRQAASRLHVRLSTRGPLDVVLDASDTTPAEQTDVFQRVFGHLRAGGVYLVRRVQPSDDPAVPDLWDVVSAARATRLRDYRDHLDRGVDFRDVVGLATTLGQVESRGKALRLVSAARVHPKIREEEVDAVLAAAPRIGERLEALPATAWEAAVDYRSNRDDRASVPDAFEVPELVLRRFDRPLCARGQVVTSRHLLLPATYRHFWRERLLNVHVIEKAPLFGSPWPRIRDPEPLPGAYFHFDCEWPGHFGHLLTDQVSRLWAWERVRAIEPEVKLLTTLQSTRSPYALAPFEEQILDAFDVTPDDVHLFDAPCQPERLYTATGMYSLPAYVHPEMARLWDRIGDRLARNAPERPRAARLFVSRRPTLKRGCHNSAELETIFAERGFEVVYPEEHPLAEQVAMFRAAEVVAGFAGSGLFTLALTSTPKRVLTLAPHSYTARNEYVIAAVRGHELTAVWSEPDVPHPVGGWTIEAFSSSFTFDLAREGTQLSEWFDTLAR